MDVGSPLAKQYKHAFSPPCAHVPYHPGCNHISLHLTNYTLEYQDILLFFFLPKRIIGTLCRLSCFSTSKGINQEKAFHSLSWEAGSTMLHSRLRPAPRRNPSTTTTTASAPAPDFHDVDGSSDIEESPEDLFGAFLPHLFPDDAPSFHGDPGQYLLYSSPRYGELEIMVPSYPGQSRKKSEEVAIGLEKKEGVNHAKEGRQLFAHFLWSAGMVVAEGVENANCLEDHSAAQKEAREIWSVDGETVMELGAGKFFEAIRYKHFSSLISTTQAPLCPLLSVRWQMPRW